MDLWRKDQFPLDLDPIYGILKSVHKMGSNISLERGIYMGKSWNVKVDDRPYTVVLKGGKVVVNEETTKLNKCLSKKGWFHTEYQVPVGSKKAMLVISNLIGGTKLVIDGKDCATGEDYVATKVPKWAYIFMVLHLVNCINGAIGALIAIVGCSLTASVSSNPKFSILVKVLLDIVILVFAVVLIVGLAIAVYSA